MARQAYLKEAKVQKVLAAREQAALEPERVKLDREIAESQRDMNAKKARLAREEQAARQIVDRAQELLKAEQAEQEVCNKKVTKLDIDVAERSADLRTRQQAAKQTYDSSAAAAAECRSSYARLAALRRQKLQEEVARLKAWRPLLQATGEWAVVSRGDEACNATPPHPASFTDPGAQADDSPSPPTSPEPKQTHACEAFVPDPLHAATVTPPPLKRPREDGASPSCGSPVSAAKTMEDSLNTNGGEAGRTQRKVTFALDRNQVHQFTLRSKPRPTGGPLKRRKSGRTKSASVNYCESDVKDCFDTGRCAVCPHSSCPAPAGLFLFSFHASHDELSSSKLVPFEYSRITEQTSRLWAQRMQLEPGAPGHQWRLALAGNAA